MVEGVAHENASLQILPLSGEVSKGPCLTATSDSLAAATPSKPPGTSAHQHASFDDNIDISSARRSSLDHRNSIHASLKSVSDTLSGVARRLSSSLRGLSAASREPETHPTPLQTLSVLVTTWNMHNNTSNVFLPKLSRGTSSSPLAVELSMSSSPRNSKDSTVGPYDIIVMGVQEAPTVAPPWSSILSTSQNSSPPLSPESPKAGKRDKKSSLPQVTLTTANSSTTFGSTSASAQILSKVSLQGSLSQGLSASSAWVRVIKDHCGSDYVHVASESLASISICVFCRKKWSKSISVVETNTVATGIGGVIGNKGAAAVAATILDHTFLFVNVHLSAHQQDLAKRNSDYSRIEKNLRFPRHDAAAACRDTLEFASDRFDFTFFFGDTNYRLNETVNNDEAGFRAAIKLGLSPTYWEYDQLTAERKAGRAFRGMREHDVSFPPTYKFADVMARDYSPKRLPAWTDRILFKASTVVAQAAALANAAEPLCCITYDAVHNHSGSDHVPVFGVFSALIPCGRASNRKSKTIGLRVVPFNGSTASIAKSTVMGQSESRAKRERRNGFCCC